MALKLRNQWLSLSGVVALKFRTSGSERAGIITRGHVNALKAIQDNCGLAVYNLGTGKGYSVLELVEAFERVNGIKIPYVIDGRRAGDVPDVYSDPSKAERELGWRAEYGINEMVRDSWNWQKRNPNGFE